MPSRNIPSAGGNAVSCNGVVDLCIDNLVASMVLGRMVDERRSDRLDNMLFAAVVGVTAFVQVWLQCARPVDVVLSSEDCSEDSQPYRLNVDS